MCVLMLLFIAIHSEQVRTLTVPLQIAAEKGKQRKLNASPNGLRPMATQCLSVSIPYLEFSMNSFFLVIRSRGALFEWIPERKNHITNELF